MINSVFLHGVAIAVVLFASGHALGGDLPTADRQWREPNSPELFKLKFPGAEAFVKSLRKEHPRLLLNDERLKSLRSEASRDTRLGRYVAQSIQQADEVLTLPRLEYRSGPLKACSQECVRRIYALGFAWRWTGKDKYAAEAKAILLHVCGFPNWGANFLNQAELGHAVAIGYDWFYTELSVDQRRTLREALLTQAIEPGIQVFRRAEEVKQAADYRVEQGQDWGTWKGRHLPLSQALLRRAGVEWWSGCNHNWNLVCNGGLIVSVLAIADEVPEQAAEILPAIFASLPHGLSGYAPAGAWGEGPFLWNYSTDYVAAAAAALRTATGDDFGISAAPGLDRTGRFIQAICGPSGRFYTFADCPAEYGRSTMPCLFWLANRFNDSALAQFEHEFLRNHSASPLHVIWYPAGQAKTRPTPLDAHFDGLVEVVTLRGDATDPNATFVGLKAGLNQFNHGHLDLGSFVFDADGKRWVEDLAIPAMGSDKFRARGFWDRHSQGPRWEYFPTNTRAHAIPMIGGQDQNAYGKAKIVELHSEPDRVVVMIDLTPAYQPAAKRVMRKFELSKNRTVLRIKDTIVLNEAAKIVWRFATHAEVTNGATDVTLTQGDQRKKFRVVTPASAAIEVIEVAPGAETLINEPVRLVEVTHAGVAGSNVMEVVFASP